MNKRKFVSAPCYWRRTRYILWIMLGGSVSGIVFGAWIEEPFLFLLSIVTGITAAVAIESFADDRSTTC